MSKIIRVLIVVPMLRITGYRFSKYHRLNNTLFYRLFNTTLANIAADKGNDIRPTIKYGRDGKPFTGYNCTTKTWYIGGIEHYPTMISS